MDILLWVYERKKKYISVSFPNQKIVEIKFIVEQNQNKQRICIHAGTTLQPWSRTLLSLRGESVS